MNLESRLSKTQLRRSRSKSIGPRSSRVYKERRLSLVDEMLNDPFYFENMEYCPVCDKPTHSVIEKKGGNFAWFCCALFSLAGGLCLIPFFM